MTSHYAHHIIAVSKSVAEDLKSLGIAEDKIHLIYNGIDVVKLQLDGKRELNLAGINSDLSNHIIVGSIGRLEKIKGYEFLLEAISEVKKEFKNIKLIIVGEGKNRTLIENKANQLKLNDCLVLTGFLGNIMPVLSKFTIFVAPSLNEGFPFTLLEAMALKKPIIATRVGGIPEIIKHKQTGMLVPPADSFALAAAILYLLRHEHERKRLAEQALKELANFELKTMIKKTIALYG